MSQAPSKRSSTTLFSPEGAKSEYFEEPKAEPIYHVYTRRQKLAIVLLVSLAAAFSPLASNIYFPALEIIAKATHSTPETTSLTVTVYMVAQGIAPSIWGPIADCVGRRQVLIYTLLLFVGANIGLALSSSIHMIMVFRVLQAAGSSSTISIGAGVIADIAPPAERGGFIGLFAGIRQAALALGPVLGGVLGGTLGYRSIFWFLCIFGSAVTLLLVVFLPETHRGIAGNGSVPLDNNLMYPPLLSPFAPWKCEKAKAFAETEDPASTLDELPKLSWRIFLEPAKFLTEKDVACTLFFGAIVYTVYSMVTSSMTFLLTQYYGLGTVEIGASFIPNGVGCILGSIIAGRTMDQDYAAYSTAYHLKNGQPPRKKQPPADFPLERARLSQVPFLTAIFVIATVAYGLCLRHDQRAILALPLIAQFVQGYAATAVLNVNNTLTVDLYPGKSASATAANNLARCLVGAIGVSFTEEALGPDRLTPTVLFAILAGVVAICAPSQIIEWRWGPKWRAQRMERLEAQKLRQQETESS
ncbi:synaptic vesicle transporter [Phyllosticta citribraziliensis]|uniref:Synaptic vesicle transporter n=1 Tax=Phyllosticta citribraziliensis TaxID=989973 RepID=A0ABR1M5S6_9PEZI